MLDIAPNFAGSVMGIINAVGNIMGFVAPLVRIDKILRLQESPVSFHKCHLDKCSISPIIQDDLGKVALNFNLAEFDFVATPVCPFARQYLPHHILADRGANKIKCQRNIASDNCGHPAEILCQCDPI